MNLSNLLSFSLVTSMFKDQTKNETGEENAVRFVQVVEREAREKRNIKMVPYLIRGADAHTGSWTWMQNADWRARVLLLLADRQVRRAEFHEPDSMEGWSFDAVSTVPVPKIATLQLTETYN